MPAVSAPLAWRPEHPLRLAASVGHRLLPLPSRRLPRRALRAFWEPKRALGCMGIGGVSMSRRLIALLILTVTVLTACGRVQSTRPASAGYLLFLEEGFTNGGQQITVRDSGTGKIQRQLPIGTAAPDWSRYYTVTPLSGSASLTAIDPGSGRTLAQTTIPAGYALPNFSYAGTSAGLSPNGQWLALTSQGKHADSGLV